MSSTYLGLLAEFGEANILLDKAAPEYFGLSYEEARRRAPFKMLSRRVLGLKEQTFVAARLPSRGHRQPALLKVAILAGGVR